MSIHNLLNQFLGSGDATPSGGAASNGIGGTLDKLSSHLPGGLAGGAAAGGIVALLMGNKSARKFAGKAATYGGAALLGGLAYKAYRNWQQNGNPVAAAAGTRSAAPLREDTFVSGDTLTVDFQLTLVKAMVAAARADGHIDADEQQRIFQAVEQMQLTTEIKGLVFDLLHRPIALEELIHGVETIERKTELYLASCLVIDPDQTAEQAHLDQLAQALRLPPELAQQLQSQARQALTQAA